MDTDQLLLELIHLHRFRRKERVSEIYLYYTIYLSKTVPMHQSPSFSSITY